MPQQCCFQTVVCIHSRHAHGPTPGRGLHPVKIVVLVLMRSPQQHTAVQDGGSAGACGALKHCKGARTATTSSSALSPRTSAVVDIAKTRVRSISSVFFPSCGAQEWSVPGCWWTLQACQEEQVSCTQQQKDQARAHVGLLLRSVA